MNLCLNYNYKLDLIYYQNSFEQIWFILKWLSFTIEQQNWQTCLQLSTIVIYIKFSIALITFNLVTHNLKRKYRSLLIIKCNFIGQINFHFVNLMAWNLPICCYLNFYSPYTRSSYSNCLSCHYYYNCYYLWYQ